MFEQLMKDLKEDGIIKLMGSFLTFVILLAMTQQDMIASVYRDNQFATGCFIAIITGLVIAIFVFAWVHIFGQKNPADSDPNILYALFGNLIILIWIMTFIRIYLVRDEVLQMTASFLRRIGDLSSQFELFLLIMIVFILMIVDIMIIFFNTVPFGVMVRNIATNLRGVSSKNQLVGLSRASVLLSVTLWYLFPAIALFEVLAMIFSGMVLAEKIIFENSYPIDGESNHEVQSQDSQQSIHEGRL